MRLLLQLLLVIGVLTKVGLAEVHAQPQAPVIACLSGDTLTWQDGTDACGALVSIDVFAAQDESGPYTLITTVPAGTEEYELTVAEAQLYNAFYVTATYTCTPAMSAPSDTITTSPLPVPRIETIDYSPLGTRLTWTFPNDPRVTGVLVYRETDAGLTLLDEVFGTEYVDQLTQTEMAGAVYYLGSIDACSRSSFDATPYSSITLAAERDGCGGVIRLGRLIPEPWPQPFVRAFIARRTLRGTVDTIFFNSPDSLLIADDLSTDTAYSIRVTYIDTEGGSTTSFPVEFGAQRVVADDLIEIAQVTYEGGSWALRWRWNTVAQYADTEWRIQRGGSTVASGTVDPGVRDSPAPIIDLGLDASFDWRGASVTVQATDVCGVTRESAPARPAIVTATEVGVFNVEVDWELLQASTTILDDWTLRFAESTGSRALITTDTFTSYTHDVSEINVREVCYQLVTNVTLPAVFDRGQASFQWRTAPSCTLRTPRVYLPTGFIPEGYTIEYRPRLSLIEGLTYRLQIFDRWGKALFDTTDPFVGWQGGFTGKAAPTGVYLAVVELNEPGRDPIKVQQTFTLIR